MWRSRNKFVNFVAGLRQNIKQKQRKVDKFWAYLCLSLQCCFLLHVLFTWWTLWRIDWNWVLRGSVCVRSPLDYCGSRPAVLLSPSSSSSFITLQASRYVAYLNLTEWCAYLWHWIMGKAHLRQSTSDRGACPLKVLGRDTNFSRPYLVRSSYIGTLCRPSVFLSLVCLSPV